MQPIAVTKGYLRPATKSDRSLLISWIRAFTEEAMDNKEAKLNYEEWCDRYNYSSFKQIDSEL